MAERRDHKRVLIYSHDTFGLGHLRRCRAIANALVERGKKITVLVLSGSPIIGSFDFHNRVDFVRIPGVIKRHNGDYVPLGLDIDIQDTLRMRASIIRHTADAFDPDLFIVDKEPLGLRGEAAEALSLLRDRGTPVVLGLRDVLDEPTRLSAEWERKNVTAVLHELYDEIWVYGVPQIWDPLVGLGLSSAARAKVVFTGYLRCSPPAPPPTGAAVPEEPFILVTPGGGGDGDGMVDWVLRAYERDRGLPLPATIVLGPFMPRDVQAAFLARVAALPQVNAITFESNLERLMRSATAVVAMGGYNTFCEILSFDKPALLVPRTQPRLEQYIRARRATELGFTSLLVDDGTRDPAVMAAALRRLPSRPPPFHRAPPSLLDGLDTVYRLAVRLLEGQPTAGKPVFEFPA